MSEERKSFWARIFGRRESAREQRVLEYIVHRINEGATLESAVEEEYVLRTMTRGQINDLLSDPRIVQAAREKMQEAFESGELDPGGRPG